MKLNKLLVVAIATVGLVGCGVEGTYTLDKPETKKAFEADIAKMPATEQEFAKLGLAMVDTMDVSLELKSGGAASMKMTMAGMDGKAGTPKEQTGTWKKEGDEITITSDDKKDLKCTKSGKKLTCTDTKSSGKSNTMVFAKT